MSTHQPLGAPTLSSRQRTLLAIGVGLLMSLCLCIGAISKAGAVETHNFCTGAWLDRYGQPQDNCAAGWFGYNVRVGVYAHEHSACASTTTNSQKSGVNLPWTCTATPYTETVNWTSALAFTQPIMRNNTSGDTNHADGSQLLCNTYDCENG